MKYKAYALMAILLASVAALSTTFGTAHAQQGSGLTVAADKASYNAGDTTKITGSVGVTPTGQPLVIQVFNPNGAAYRFDQVKVSADGSYTYDFKVGGKLGITGPYKVTVSYNGQSKSTTFTFTAGQQQQTTGSWSVAKLMIDGKSYDINYQITNGSLKNMTADKKTATITANIASTKDGQLKIQLPRNIAEAKSGNGTDIDYVIFVDQIEEFADDDHGNATRTLTIPFAAQSETIDIVGTKVIPEFGAIAAIILGISIVGIIVATTRYSKFSFLPKM